MKNSFILFFTACLLTGFNVQAVSVSSSFYPLFSNTGVFCLPYLNKAPIYLPRFFISIAPKLTENDDFVLSVNRVQPLKKLDNRHKASQYVEMRLMS